MRPTSRYAYYIETSPEPLGRGEKKGDVKALWQQIEKNWKSI